MNYRTILIDDELLALERLKRLLEPYSEIVGIIDCAYDGRDAVEKINRLKPELIFLDIQMPELNGFEVLEQIDFLPLIIFSTAYNEYALKAFETNSIDYLLKPVEPERLKVSIEKLKRLTTGEKDTFREKLDRLLSELKKPSIKRLQVTVGDSIFMLNVCDICFFRAADKYVEAGTYDKTYLLSKTLNQLEQELSLDDFVRIHRSAIINLNHLEKIFRWFGGRYKVRLNDKNKTELDVSRNSRHKLGISSDRSPL